MRTFAALALLALLAAPAGAEPLTVAQCNDVLRGLYALDGYDAVVEDGERKKAVRQGYKLGGGLRWQISRNIVALKACVEGGELARLALIRELAPETGTVRADTPQFLRFTEGYRKILEQQQDVSISRLKLAELKPDENPYPPSVLSLLAPIIDEPK